MKNTVVSLSLAALGSLSGVFGATAPKTLPPAIANFEIRRNPALSGKRVMFYIDDVVWLFRDLARQKPARLFDNPFLKVLKEAHDKYGMKVQINCFYRTDFFYGTDEFTLAETPDRYKAEWQANKDWLRLGFHSLQEFPDYPFTNADYGDMKFVVGRIRDEVRRFAGDGVFTCGAVVHWGSCSKDACRALRDMGFGIVLATCGPRVEYGGDPSVLPYGHAMRLLQNRTEEQAKKTFGTFDYIYDREMGIGFKEIEDYQPLSAGINLYALKDIPQELNKVIGHEFVTYSYHEQYFHKDYLAYQPDYADKVMLCARMLHDAGYEYFFFEDLAAGR